MLNRKRKLKELHHLWTISHYCEEDMRLVLNFGLIVCILFNIYDSLHSDEVAEPEELELFERFLSKFSINREEINQSLEAIFVKNNLSVLS